MSLTRDRTMGAEGGFTLIELLIVVVIIGILAAVAIPQFSSTKEKAFDAAAKSDLRNLMSAQETYLAEKGEYAADLTELENVTRFSQTDAVEMSLDRPGSVEFSADASHEGSPNCFRIGAGSGASHAIESGGQADVGGGSCGS